MSDPKTRMKPEARRDQILSVALRIAVEQGYDNVTRERIAASAGISTGLVNHAFSTMTKLRRAVMRAAIQREILPIVAKGLSEGCSIAHGADNVLKYKAMTWVIDNPTCETSVDDGE